MKTKFSLIILLICALISCQKEENKRYLITRDRVGNLTKEIQVNQLDSVFPGDSVVNTNTSREFSGRNEIIIYSKEDGRELLRLQPKINFDSTSTIATVQVIDTLYRTDKGLSRGSDFEVLNKNYKVSRVENTLGTVMVFVDQMNMYVDIDKREVREPTQMGADIKASQIRKRAKIKHLWIDWQ